MKKYTVEIARARNKEWFWIIKHSNGRTIARSSETYKRLVTMERSLMNLIRSFSTAEFDVFNLDAPIPYVVTKSAIRE